MSFTIALSGRQSRVDTSFFPPISLDKGVSYECALIYFKSYNSIPNVNNTNNKFYYDTDKVIELPTGTYEFKDISEFIKNKINYTHDDDFKKANKLSKTKTYTIDIEANNNTLHSEMRCSAPVHFNKPNSIGRLLGFNSTTYQPNVLHKSESTIDISPVNTLRIQCNIIENSYNNGRPDHTIHEFSPTVPPGYQIIEVPSSIIYLPVNVEIIDTISLSVVDESGQLVNFRNENISIRLHLRKI